MRAEHHTAVSVLFSGLLLGLTGSFALAVSSLLSGIFMDVDHLFDYFMEFGRPFRIRQFFKASYAREYRRIYLLLHAWEWFIPGLLICWMVHWNPWILGLFLGWIQHMLADQLVNKPAKMGYFLIGRWRQDFSHDICFPKKDAFIKES